MLDTFVVETFDAKDSAALVALWQACDLVKPWNDPIKDINRKLKDCVGGLFVIHDESKLIGSVMVGYDGHRGSVYYLAVHPHYQAQGLGCLLMNHCETFLLALECPKINLFVRDTNVAVLEFYGNRGYALDASKTLGKRLIADD